MVDVAREVAAGAAPHEYGERRDVIVQAVIRLVARSGLRGVTYRGVAREAGVAHGLIAHHFGSIDALLEVGLLETIDSSVAGLDLHPSSGRLEDFASDLLEGVSRRPDHFAFQYQVMLEARLSGDVKGRLAILHGRYRQILRDSLEDMGVPSDDATVELVYALLEGVVFHQLTHVDFTSNSLALERLRSLLSMMSEAAPQARS